MRRELEFWRGERSPFSLLNDMDRFFSQFNVPEHTAEPSSFSPAVDVEEHDDHFVLSFDLPGLSKNDVNIEVLEDRLVVSGERKDERRFKEGRTERAYGRFERAFTLPAGADAGKIEARFENGVLEIAVPKAEMAKPRKIEIKASDGQDAGILGRFLGRKSAKETGTGRDQSQAV
ncbi:MAG TPA: Hsp20/alpha crystallin family protein [Bdellovibrionales bacterium]|nr:Hsp20/alpha crystallin family protein [Bdellovibrionales bacterium]